MFVKDFFKAIDVLFYRAQNNCPEIKGKENQVEVTKDIVYDDSQPSVCLLDLYRNKNAEKLPVMLYVHGGGFMAGGKKYRRAVCTYFSLAGMQVVAADYGLAPEYSFPAPLKHLVCALKWIGQNSEKYGFDTTKLTVAGDSAGAYYAAMLCAASVNPSLLEKLNIDIDIKPRAAILNCGLYDVQKSLDGKMLLDIDKRVFNQFTGKDVRFFDEYVYKDFCSPLNFINENFPPSLIIYAKKDVFCKGQSEALIEKLYDKNVYVKSFFSQSFVANHCFSFMWKTRQAKQANELTLSFLKTLSDGTLSNRRIPDGAITLK